MRSRPVAEPLTVFCAALRELRRAAGQPSLAALGGAMPRRPGASTLSDLLNAKVTTAPDWGLVAEFVTACTTSASRELPAELADLARWRRRHADLERELDAIRRHTTVTPPAVATATTLPHDIVTFTGRERELAFLADAVAAARSSGSVGIVAIDGMAGVGKTSLAVRAAHLMARKFPDGQLFVDLHAHTAGQSPVRPADALHALLSAVGVEPGAIPERLDERSALWRSRLANRRTLVVLDDAVGHEQVTPLLPGTPGACVLITGRRRLAALDGAVMMPLDILSPAEAAELFVRTAGTGDPRSEAVRELTAKVGHLPLAIRLLAGRLRSRPTWTVADLIGELDTARNRSATIRAENVIVGVVFDLSFNALPENVRPVFRGLGLHPGVDFDVSVAAALAGVTEEEARHGLDVLYDDHLIEEPVRGRYRLHDLVRDYARGLAPTETRHDAMARLLAHYLAAADAADDRLRGRGPEGNTLASRAMGKAWLDVELPNLLATIEHTVGEHGVAAVRLSHLLSLYLHRHGQWRHGVKLFQTASRAARETDDRAVEADALRDLGLFHRLLSDYEEAEPVLNNALALYEELGDRRGKAGVLMQTAAVLRHRGRYREAIERATQSLELATEFDYRRGIIAALGEISESQCRLGEHSAARENALAALRMCHGLGDRIRESSTLQTLGFAELNMGLLDDAEERLTAAVRLAREANYRIGEADALHFLGVVAHRNGRPEVARTLLGDALDIFIDLGDARGQASALNDLGILMREHDPRAARRCHVLALRIDHSIANPSREAQSWEGIGRALVAGGDTNGGLRRLRRALAIYQRIGEHDWRRLNAFIAELEGGGPG